MTMAIMIYLVAFIVIHGVPHLKPSLFSLTYNSDNVSLMPALVNTLIITALSLVIAIPFGVFAAIYLVEYAKKGSRLVHLIRVTAETLSGIPAVCCAGNPFRRSAGNGAYRRRDSGASLHRRNGCKDSEPDGIGAYTGSAYVCTFQ